jgi:hypothetical protein
MATHHTILRMEKRKSVSSIVSMGLHNHRHRITKNADTKRTHLNRILIGTSRVENDYRARMATVNIVESDIRKNGTRALEFMLAFSPSWVRDEHNQYIPDAKLKIQAWILKSIEWLRKEFGENLINTVVHL